MKHLIHSLLAFAFVLSGSYVEADCKVPQGPPGPPPAYYIGSYSDTTQDLDVPNVGVNVLFPNNFDDPFGIMKSAINDSFTVLFDGVYLISWTVNASSERFLTPPNFLALTLKVDGIAVLPNPIARSAFVGSGSGEFPTAIDLSGQKLLNLQAGAIITLEAKGTFTINTESIQIDSALFNIAQVADAP